MYQQRKVAVVGLGVVSALGLTAGEFWDGLTAGRCGIGPLTLFDTSSYRTSIGAQVCGLDDHANPVECVTRRLSRCDRLGLVAAAEAVLDSGIDFASGDPSRAGVLLGGGAGGMLSGEAYRKALYGQKGGAAGRPRPSLLIPFSPSYTTDLIATRFGLTGPRSTVVTACSSSSTSVGKSADWIRRGEADIMITGGADAMCELTYSGFNSLRAVDLGPCRPFDRERKGLSLGEGAAILVLEEMERAKARGARIYAEIAGYGIACDAYHMTSPELSGDGPARTIAAALADAGANSDEVDYVNAHGTATKYNDLAETRAIKAVLGERAYKVPVSSIKSMIGHCLGAAGGMEAAASVLSVYHGVIPPTINYENPDPECDLDCTPNEAREQEIKLALSNSFAFGGNNTAVVIKKV